MSGGGASLPPPPRANPELRGHEAAEAELRGAALSGRLHHAWLFCGPPGIGKATLAWRFARWLLAGLPTASDGLHLPARHPVFRRAAAGAHADLLALDPEPVEGRKRRAIPVEEARAAVRFLSFTPAEGGHRVVLLDEAEAMDAPAANTLLKTLEEPPRATVLLLVTAAPGRLLPTIRSRCRRLDLAPLAAAPMASLLEAWLPALGAAERARLLTLAEGAPGRALALAEGQGLELAALAEATLENLPGTDALALAERVAGRAAERDGAAFATFLALLVRAVQVAVREAARRAEAGQEGTAWLDARPLHAWAESAAAVARLAGEAERLSLDRQQCVIEALRLLRGG